MKLSHLAGPAEAVGRSYWLQAAGRHGPTIFRHRVHRTFSVSDTIVPRPRRDRCLCSKFRESWSPHHPAI